MLAGSSRCRNKAQIPKDNQWLSIMIHTSSDRVIGAPPGQTSPLAKSIHCRMGGPPVALKARSAHDRPLRDAL